MAKSVKYTVNFLEAKEEDLYKYDVFNVDLYWFIIQWCHLIL